MPEEIIHKLIVPPPRTGNLNELILCWSKLGWMRIDNAGLNTRFTTNINDATCPDCKLIWVTIGQPPVYRN